MNRALAALGVAAVVVGITAFVRPSALAGVSLPGLLVGLFGVLAVVLALFLAYGRLAGEDTVDLPEPERRHVASVPGDDFDERLAVATRHGRVGSARDRDELRDHLARVTVDVLSRYDGITAEEARTRMEEGTWTDHTRAAAFFAPPGTVDVSPTERVRMLVASDVTFRLRARAVVQVLAARLEER